MEMKGATLSFADPKTGKPVFELKRKDNADYGGEGLYYIFKIHEENFSSPEAKEIFKSQLFPDMATMASMLGLPLFNVDEMGEQIQSRAKEILDSKVDLNKKQLDVVLELMNYATNELQNLTIGISTKPVSEME